MAKKPTLDEMRLALSKVMPTHQREANKAKFLEPSKVKHVMYHGTNANLNEFRPNDKNAHFVTPSAKFADDFLGDYQGYENGENIMPVHVQTSNPFDFENKEHIKNLEDLIKSRKFFYKPVKEMMPRIKRGHWEALEFPTTMHAIKELGHDAMHVLESDREGNPVKNLAVFNPKKIKSAIGNRGTYDTTDPDITKAEGGDVHMAEGGLTWNSPEWKPHPENDLLHPIGASKMVGDEKLLSQDNTFSHGLSEFPSSKKSYRYLYHGEDKKPIGSMQIQTTGPRSKKAVIQNLYVAEANRRQGIASKLLDRARQDFDVKHSTDLTTSGKAFAKAKKAKGGEVKYPSIEEMLQKLREAGRTPVMPAPDRWFKHPEKHPFQQKAIEKLLAHTGHGREAFPFGAHINPITGEPLDFEIMHDLGVAIDPNTGNPMMSGIKSGLTEIDPKLGSLTKSNLIRKGLFKHEGGDPLLDRIKFLATIEKSGKGHHYGLSTQYASPAELVQEMTGNPTLRPHSRGDIYGVGDEIGRISIKGKHHPVYEKLLVAPSGSDVQGKKLHKAKGGGIPPHIKASMDQMKAELQAKVAQDKAYHHAIRNMPFDQIPTFEQWKQSQPTHAHHLEIEERPL